jgi:hypothetical protein
MGTERVRLAAGIYNVKGKLKNKFSIAIIPLIHLFKI